MQANTISQEAQRVLADLATCKVYNRTHIPGMLRTGPRGLAEALRLPQDKFELYMSELREAGLVIMDWSWKIVYVPSLLQTIDIHAITTTTTGLWRFELDGIPDLPIRERIEHDLQNRLNQLCPGRHDLMTSFINGEYDDSETD